MAQWYVDNALQGAGDHSTPGNSGQFDLLWAKLSAGDNVEVADGTNGDGKFQGDKNMIQPTVNGSDGSPITIVAKNDGMPWIDGQFARTPIKISAQHWLIVDGVDCSRGLSGADIVAIIGNADDNIIRRVCAWDLPLGSNLNIFGAHGTGGATGAGSNRNLFEDCGGWGTARKIWSNSQGGHSTIFRRCFGRWEGSTSTNGPKFCFQLYYNSFNCITENCIGMWSGESQGPVPPTNIRIIFGEARIDDDYSVHFGDPAGTHKAHAKSFGNIAILQLGDLHPAGSLFGLGQDTEAEFRDCAAVIEDGDFSWVEPFFLTNHTRGDGLPYPDPMLASKLHALGGNGNLIQSQWSLTDVKTDTPSDIWSELPNTGARLCKRYVDGVLTSTALWPWPMEARLDFSMKRSGRPAGLSIESIVQRHFGTIPGGCLGTPPPDPDPPDVKRIWIGGGSTDGGADGV